MGLVPQPRQLRVNLFVGHVGHRLDLDWPSILAGELTTVCMHVAHFLRNSLKHIGHAVVVLAVLEGVSRPGELLDAHGLVRVWNSFLDVIEEGVASMLKQLAPLLRQILTRPLVRVVALDVLRSELHRALFHESLCDFFRAAKAGKLLNNEGFLDVSQPLFLPFRHGLSLRV
jgi:hypothetical protein